MTSSLTPREFEESARRALMAVESALDALADDSLDSDLAGSVLTIEFETGDRFVLNTNAPALEIWLSANRRAWHFAPRAGGGGGGGGGGGERWTSTAAGGEELLACLSRLVGEKLGRTVTLGG